MVCSIQQKQGADFLVCALTIKPNGIYERIYNEKTY